MTRLDPMTLLVAANYYASPDYVPWALDHPCWNAILPATTAGPTRIIMESTARGHGDTFYERCTR